VPQCGVQVVHQPDVGGVVQALALAQQPGLRHEVFDFLMAVLGQRRLLGFFVDRVIAGPSSSFCRVRRGISVLILM